MWGPDKYLEETPDLTAAIQELRRRFAQLRRTEPLTLSGLDVGDGVLLKRAHDGSNYVEVDGRRAYTEIRGDPTYAHPPLLFDRVLPALRQYMLLDDIVTATEEVNGEHEGKDHPDRNGV